MFYIVLLNQSVWSSTFFASLLQSRFQNFHLIFPSPKIRKLSQTHSLSKEKKATEDIPAIDDNNCVACFSFILSCSLHRNECLALPRSSPFYLLLCHFFRLFFIMCTFGIFFPIRLSLCLSDNLASPSNKHRTIFYGGHFHSAWINFIWGNKHLHLISDTNKTNE